MVKNKKDFLARKILLGILTASVLYGGAFVSQAEAEEKTLADGADAFVYCIGDGNTLNLTGGTFESRDDMTITFRGGYNNPTGTANNNTLNVDGAALFKKSNGGTIHIFGGSTVSTIPYEASYNQVKFITGSIYEDGAIEDVRGGTSASGQSYKNSVHIASTWDSEHSITRIIGGHSMYGNVKENTIKMEGGKVKNIIGGQSDFGNVTDNEIVITGGTVVGTGAITGGMVSGVKPESITSGNKVSISGATNITTSMIRGGSNCNGTVSKNEVSISSGTLKVDEIIGGHLTSTGKIAEKNSVTITGGVITTEYIRGGIASSGIAKDNHITIGSAATITKGSSSTDLRIYGGIVGGTGGRAEGNIITINNNISDVYIYGGSSDADATGNQVIIQGGTINGEILGGWSNKGTATGNTLILEGGTINSGRIVGGYSSSGEATGNVVELRGAKIIGNVNGGTSESGTAHDNIIKVYGGDLSEALLNSDKIEIHGKDLNIQHIADFNQLNFYIPNTVTKDSTILTINGGEKTNLTNTKVSAGVQNGTTLTTGDTVTLLKNASGITTTGMTTGTLTGAGYMNYAMDIASTGTELKATIGKEMGLSPETKSLTETRAGGMAILNDGAALMAGSSLVNAKAAAHGANVAAQSEGASQPAGFAPFASMGANSMRYNTGSHVDSKGWGINVGVARELNFSKSILTIAPLVEYGRSNYDSYLDQGTHGSGKQQFFGVGMLVRQDNDNGLYTEGSVRVGHMKGDYSSGDLNTSYDTSSNYAGFHAGVGKILNLDEKNKLDVYGKFFYTRQGSDSVNLSTGAQYDFDAINSYRTRLGARWTTEVDKKSEVYVGLAWDHEFDSEARASYRGYSTPTPGMKGDSGMLELGWQVNPKENGPLTVDLNLTGWCGKQQGIGANANFVWHF